MDFKKSLGGNELSLISVAFGEWITDKFFVEMEWSSPTAVPIP